MLMNLIASYRNMHAEVGEKVPKIRPVYRLWQIENSVTRVANLQIECQCH